MTKETFDTLEVGDHVHLTKNAMRWKAENAFYSCSVGGKIPDDGIISYLVMCNVGGNNYSHAEVLELLPLGQRLGLQEDCARIMIFLHDGTSDCEIIERTSFYKRGNTNEDD